MKTGLLHFDQKGLGQYTEYLSITVLKPSESNELEFLHIVDLDGALIGTDGKNQ